jgi:polysaccharide pyruvyl transferase WcaK-like protein
MNLPAKIILAFDFYGSGNIGDDLMLAGFLAGLEELWPQKNIEIIGTSRWEIDSQRRRFGSLRWLTPADFRALGERSASDALLAGVGDTPVQITCSRWSLDHMLNLRSCFKGARRVLINVGAESEAQSHRAEFQEALNQFERISVRDTFSAEVLRRILDGHNDKVVCGGDLASLALKRIAFSKRTASRTGRCLVIAADTLEPADLDAVAEYLETSQRVDFIANDVKNERSMESNLYRRLAPGRLMGLFRRGRLLVPDYNTSDWRDLVRHYMDVEVVVSARYHGILCAAYAGCRVGAIARSSKVEALAKELRIPFCTPPLTPTKIRDTFNDAALVPNENLAEMESRSLHGVECCLRE